MIKPLFHQIAVMVQLYLKWGNGIVLTFVKTTYFQQGADGSAEASKHRALINGCTILQVFCKRISPGCCRDILILILNDILQ